MFLKNLWYFALPSRAVPPGRMTPKEFLGEPVMFARDLQGQVFAFRDLCPHRGVPLSAGKLVEGTVECPYHGWRFKPSGQCHHIPSLVSGQDLDPGKISVRTYPVSESNGLIWVYIAEQPGEAPKVPAPALDLPPGARPRMQEMQLFPCELDSAVVGLMDPAHGPFVHKSWWWRSTKSMYEKAKDYAPVERGFTMVAHKPSRNSTIYHLLGGDLTTEIAFHLPGIRIETIKAGKNQILSLTTCTPVDATKTEVTQTFFWNIGWLWAIRPFFRPMASAFLAQDRHMVTLQQEAARFQPRQMLIQDADTPAIWYFRLKKEWATALEEGRTFDNPVKPVTLRWRS
ncbi:MAG TPA: 2Fe-2S ferredoxin [Alphaproteobacteria bacterium]|nr:2Fe-2S ferredoxin [Alphaproteobacteria bacterium]HAJ45109.1 2Fe-2S ferredoxin [Alphaproteobacteria bacterium]